MRRLALVGGPLAGILVVAVLIAVWGQSSTQRSGLRTPRAAGEAATATTFDQQAHDAQALKDLSQGTPAADPNGFIDSLPSCIPVDNYSGLTMGCVHKTDEFPSSPTALDAGSSPGIPVYADATSNTIVGYEGATGFVPASLAGQADQIASCQAVLKGAIASGTSGVSDACKALLAQQGVRQSILDAH